MSQDKKGPTAVRAERATSAIATGDPEAHYTYWNHIKTWTLIVATLTLYFCQLQLLVGGGAFSRSIAAAVGGENLTSWPALLCTIFTIALIPPVAQAVDYWGRKWFLVIPNFFGFAGAIIIARAENYNVILAGFAIGAVSFATTSIFSTVVSEVLPRKHRSWGQAAVNTAAATGSIFSLTVGGYLTRNDPSGFRTYFYIVAGLYGGGSIACAFLYNSAPRDLEVNLTLKQKLQALDWISYGLVASGTALFCLGLSWAQNPYPWTDAHVLAPFLIGVALLAVLGVYAWKFKKDGLLHHALFQDRNMVISLICVFIEGMAFMAANVYFPYTISVVRGDVLGPFQQALCYMIAFPNFALWAFVSALYIYKTKKVRIPGVITYISFVIFFILMATINVDTPASHFWGYVVFYGLGLGVCLVVLVTAAQFSTRPELISITSGFILTVRSLGGSIGSAIYNPIFAHGLQSTLAPKITAAVLPLGLPKAELGTLIEGLATENTTLVKSIPGITPQIIEAAERALVSAYIVGFRDVFITAGAFSFVAIFIVAFLRNPSKEFTKDIDAPIELGSDSSDLEGKAAS
ncbi:hypothetical protein G7046_g6328 [Stylonectria norvegica]|nr:hypothetical protein G7046_g6328 [Stylonectria norvegica]